MQQEISGSNFGPEPLHRIFTIVAGTLPQPRGFNVQGAMPFLYGMRFTNCNLRYRLPVTDGIGTQHICAESQPISVTAIDPSQSSPEHPYSGYPQLLPYVPLREAARKRMSQEEFVGGYTWQGLDDIRNDDLIVVAPPVVKLGVSIWGRTGDDECVLTVFRCRYSTLEVEAFSQCP